MSMKLAAAVSSYLFADTHAHVYAILDGASVDGLLGRLYEYEPEYECLYRGELEPDIAEVAPYLVRLDPKSAFTDWIVASGWGNHWGIFPVSRASLADLRRHFRRFLTVHDTAGTPMLFRYYDPRVLRVYLPTCEPGELEAIFGPVMHFVAEGETPEEFLRFQLHNRALTCSTKKLNQEV